MPFNGDMQEKYTLPHPISLHNLNFGSRASSILFLKNTHSFSNTLHAINL